MDIEKLEKLSELKDKGILTELEFEQKKKELLDDSGDKKIKEENKKDSEPSLWDYFSICVGEKYACFKGRARRKEYWGYGLFYVLIKIILSIFVILIGGSVEALNVADWIVTLILFLPTLGVLVRRLHDVNLSGWWVLTLIVPTVVIFFKSEEKENKYGSVPVGILK